MHACAVLTLYDRPLTAYGLDRIEEAVPDTDAGQSERALELPLHSHKHVLADYKSDQGRDQSRHGKHLPVGLIDEHTEILPQVDRDLGNSSAVVSCHEFELGIIGRLV